MISEKFQPIYANTWDRLLASFIDHTILIIIALLLGFINTKSSVSVYATNQDIIIRTIVTGIVIYIITNIIYFAIMESSQVQATIGKMIFGIIVTDMKGRRIPFIAALLRALGASLLSYRLIAGVISMIWSGNHFLTSFDEEYGTGMNSNR